VGAGKIQYRLDPTMGNLALSKCTNPPQVPPDSGDACLTEVYNKTTNNGADLSKLNIVFVPKPDCCNGWHSHLANGQYWVAIADSFIGAPNLRLLIAHELGHMRLGHRADADPGCVGGASTNYVMCSALGNDGRVFSASECTSLRTPPAYVQDHN
jgi:hypothetical protein